MNMEEYKKRIENVHTLTGVPSYWEELQKALQELESVKKERDDLQHALDLALKIIVPSDSGLI